MSIPITKVFLGDEEKEAIIKPLETGWVVQGPYVREFEEKFSRFVDIQHALATTSCTTALHIAVTALELGPGDEVIVPAFTWVATANVVEYMGAKPVFCDVDLQTFNIDVSKIESLITERTVGIIPVHLFGLCADMDPILAIAREHGLWVVEDAACALGGWYKNRHAGTFGDAGCFSFHPRKSITTGEGGMITTNDGSLASLSASLRDHGASRTDLERHESRAAFLLPKYEVLGYNFRMTDLQGALGSVQMDRASWILDRRRECAAYYDRSLEEVEWLRTPMVPDTSIHGYQAYVCLFAPEEPNLQNVERLNGARNRVMTELEDRGISTRQGTHAPVIQGFYQKKYGLRVADFGSSYIADRLSLTLPLYPQMTRVEQDRVVEALVSVGSAF